MNINTEMSTRSRSRGFFPGMVLATALFAIGSVVQAQESDALSILKAMSQYVSKQNIIELTFDSTIEVITPQLEKIQFTNSGGALLSRPGKLRAHRLAGHSDVSLFFDGKTVRYIDGRQKAIFTIPRLDSH